MNAPQPAGEPAQPHPAWVGFFAEVLRLDAELSIRLDSQQAVQVGSGSLSLDVSRDVLQPTSRPALAPQPEPSSWGSQTESLPMPHCAEEGQARDAHGSPHETV